MPVDELLAITVAYLLGSVPVGYLLVRLRTGRDLRQSGSGSTGASNAARLLGRPGFAVVFVLDLLKGSAAVLLASSFADARWAAAGAGIAAVAGHLWPIWLGFRGGKGLATGFGACLVVSPLVAALALVTLGVLLPVLRPSLVALVVALMLAPVSALVLDREAAIGVLIMALLVLTGHRTNIRALLPGGADHARVAVGWANRPSVRPTAGRSKR
jgi:glycerol-3-phosphate acyltransferase PlsY